MSRGRWGGGGHQGSGEDAGDGAEGPVGGARAVACPSPGAVRAPGPSASGQWASFRPVSVVIVVIVITSRLSSFSSHAHLRHGCRLFCRRSGHTGDREGPAGLGRPTPVEICGPLDVFLTKRW